MMRLRLAGVSGEPFKANSVALWVVVYKSQHSARSSMFKENKIKQGVGCPVHRIYPLKMGGKYHDFSLQV